MPSNTYNKKSRVVSSRERRRFWFCFHNCSVNSIGRKEKALEIEAKPSDCDYLSAIYHASIDQLYSSSKWNSKNSALTWRNRKYTDVVPVADWYWNRRHLFARWLIGARWGYYRWSVLIAVENFCSTSLRTTDSSIVESIRSLDWLIVRYSAYWYWTADDEWRIEASS